MPTQCLSHSPSSTGQGEKKRWRSLWLRWRQGDRLPITVTGKIDLTQGRLIYFLPVKNKVERWEKNTNGNNMHPFTHPPAFFPGSTSLLPRFLCLLTLPWVVQGDREWGLGIAISPCQFLSTTSSSSHFPLLLQASFYGVQSFRINLLHCGSFPRDAVPQELIQCEIQGLQLPLRNNYPLWCEGLHGLQCWYLL